MILLRHQSSSPAKRAGRLRTCAPQYAIATKFSGAASKRAPPAYSSLKGLARGSHSRPVSGRPEDVSSIGTQTERVPEQGVPLHSKLLIRRSHVQFVQARKDCCMVDSLVTAGRGARSPRKMGKVRPTQGARQEKLCTRLQIGLRAMPMAESLADCSRNFTCSDCQVARVK